jgi:hypothetical protein
MIDTDVHERTTIGQGQCVGRKCVSSPVLRFRRLLSNSFDAASGRLPASSPNTTPAPSPSASAANESDDQQQDQRADGGVDDRRNDARAKMDAELRKQPTADEGAYDSNDDIADDPEPGTLHDLTGQPPGNEADQQYDQETFS